MTDEARCLREPHLFTPWNVWTPLQPSVSPFVAVKPPTKPEPIPAYRERICRRCGVVEEENYQGERRVVSDPYGIDAALNPPSPSVSA